jgi:NAD(P)-dependent dehydrogenase (short-subunit alcohol dehydrogenase family)
MNDLAEKVAIVTGAAQGLGAQYAIRLAAAGVKVVAADARSAAATVASIEKAGGSVIPARVDVCDPRSIDAMVNLAEKAFGAVQILINNAAIAADLQMKPFLEIETADWDMVMNVNARGTFECIKAVAPCMIENRYGKIVNIASTTFFKGASRMMHYVASKGAVIGITRVAARELGDHGITVNCIAPGLTMTDPIRAKGMFDDVAYQASISSRAIKREQVPADLAGGLLFLVSSQSDFITGQTIVIDGGNVMM